MTPPGAGDTPGTPSAPLPLGHLLGSKTGLYLQGEYLTQSTMLQVAGGTDRLAAGVRGASLGNRIVYGAEIRRFARPRTGRRRSMSQRHGPRAARRASRSVRCRCRSSRSLGSPTSPESEEGDGRGAVLRRRARSGCSSRGASGKRTNRSSAASARPIRTSRRSSIPRATISAARACSSAITRTARRPRDGEANARRAAEARAGAG